MEFSGYTFSLASYPSSTLVHLCERPLVVRRIETQTLRYETTDINMNINEHVEVTMWRVLSHHVTERSVLYVGCSVLYVPCCM